MSDQIEALRIKLQNTIPGSAEEKELTEQIEKLEQSQFAKEPMPVVQPEEDEIIKLYKEKVRRLRKANALAVDENVKMKYEYDIRRAMEELKEYKETML
jgi:hypothetical protein